ncbi:hypothetical protein SAMN04487948_11925 [Halogranum amylolyticum]|uniref:Uncharacterized protein n=1 Tax=Halogranum amylolyticum TaxID=660520 RepID=A0A1H8VSC6_9EURY|nr:hypothetical protein SAMN04487948_11925 [Halogranum amylolyticum]
MIVLEFCDTSGGIETVQDDVALGRYSEEQPFFVTSAVALPPG